MGSVVKFVVLIMHICQLFVLWNKLSFFLTIKMILKNNNFYKFNYGFQSKKRRVLKLNTILLESRWIKDFFWGTILSHLFYYPVPSNLNYWASVRV